MRIHQIDEMNRICYNKLAVEYDDPTHNTVSNFNDATGIMIKYATFFMKLAKGFNYLDVGVGTGVSLFYLRDFLLSNIANVDVLDISEMMIHVCINKYSDIVHNTYTSSINNFITYKKYNLIVCTMADPFIGISSISTLSNIIDERGFLFITIPTKEWAINTRSKKDFNITIFKTKIGKEVRGYSQCLEDTDLLTLLRLSGFKIRYLQSVFFSDLTDLNKLSNINNQIYKTKGDIPFCYGLLLQYFKGGLNGSHC